MVNVRKFVGKTAREALAALKAELGADAVVLSNRSVPGGVEIVALPPEAMGELNATVRQAREPQTHQPAPQAAPFVNGQPAGSGKGGASAGNGKRIGEQIAAELARRSQPQPAGPRPVFRSGIDAPDHDADTGGRQMVRPFTPPRVRSDGSPLNYPGSQSNAGADHADVSSTPQRRPAEHASQPAQPEQEESRVRGLEAANAALMHELASIKGMLERQLAGFAWSEISRTAPTRTQMMSELLEAGFSAQLTHQLTQGLAGGSDLNEARNQVRQLIARDLQLQDAEADIIDRGGVYALVGPTGVGKTTTTAKLAARCVVRHGADRLALITTDGYRIGAHEQLRIYGRILGVPVHVVRDASDLRSTLQELRKKHMVLIDTVGMSQRDKMVGEQAAMLNSVGKIARILCLNATVRGDTMDDVIRAYVSPDTAGCIFTKLDEANSIAPALDVSIRHALPMLYIANGQRVPEDLHLPNRNYLLHRALREIPADSPWKLDRSEAGLLMAAPRLSTGEGGNAGL
ncbi:flagellar biosynthesis protein FlhF [Viridibacterium curvum]|uniref:Flagellar biosynthesis protein FlhF n=1 Tax=Viridibacterium curvum TaxID=1101404 RepID=A0ABP9QCD0_9RHOO